MEYELRPEQVIQIVRAARVLDPGFTEERLKWLTDGQKRLADSGFCEASWAVARFERERGVSCADVLDACEERLREESDLEDEVARLKESQQTQLDVIRDIEQKHRQMTEAVGQARSELEKVKAEREKEERQVAAFQKKSEKEKRRIDRELEEYRQEANVTKEETATASRLKAEVEEYGFSLGLALELAQEFAGYEDIRGKLAEGLKEGLTLTRYNEEAAEQKEVLQSDIQGLTGECQQLGSNLSQLQANVAFEGKVRQFYHRYQGAGVVMEFLASWKDIFFVRCGNPTYAATSVLDRSIRGARFWTEKPPIRRCPCCDYPGAFYDEELYQALNWKVGDSFQLKLGE